MVKLTRVSASRTLNAAVQAAKTQGELAGRSVNQKCHPSVVRAMMIAGAALAVAGGAYALSQYSQGQQPVCAEGFVDTLTQCFNTTFVTRNAPVLTGGIVNQTANATNQTNVTVLTQNTTNQTNGTVVAPNATALTVTNQTSGTLDGIISVFWPPSTPIADIVELTDAAYDAVFSNSSGVTNWVSDTGNDIKAIGNFALVTVLKGGKYIWAKEVFSNLIEGSRIYRA